MPVKILISNYKYRIIGCVFGIIYIILSLLNVIDVFDKAFLWFSSIPLLISFKIWEIISMGDLFYSIAAILVFISYFTLLGAAFDMLSARKSKRNVRLMVIFVVIVLNLYIGIYIIQWDQNMTNAIDKLAPMIIKKFR